MNTSELPFEVSKGTPDISWGGYFGTSGWMLDMWSDHVRACHHD